MTAKQKKLFLLTSMMSVFVMVVTVLFTGGKLSLSPIGVRGGGELVEGSITWNKDSNKTKISNYKNYSFYSKTARGTGIYLYSFTNYEPSGNNIFDSGNSDADYGVYVTSEYGNKESLFSFQQITSVTISTGKNTSFGGSNGFKFYTNGPSGSYTSATGLQASTTYTFTTEVANATSLIIKPNSGQEIDITSLTIEYSCTPGGAPAEKTMSSISVSGQTTEFTVGDSFSFGGTVTAHYSDSSSADVTSSATFTGYNMTVADSYTVTVSYTEGTTKTTTYSITVSEESSSVTLSGLYEFTSRTDKTGSSDIRWNGTDTYQRKMTISFNSNGTVVWRATRYNLSNQFVDAKVNLSYTAIDNGANIEVSMELVSIDFTVGGAKNTSATTFTGGTYDRPCIGFGVGAKNESGVVSSNRSSLSIKVYSSSTSPYSEWDTFIFSLVS